VYTKPLTHQPIKTLDLSHDLKIIGRFLIAASINSGFCAKLLSDPVFAVKGGFGGEQFHLSDSTLNVVSSIRASTLTEFICQLNRVLDNKLLRSEIIEITS